MIAKNVSRETLEWAAQEIGVRAEIEPTGKRFRVKLFPVVPASAWQVDFKRSRLCPVCGQKVKVRAETTGGHLVGTCGDSAAPERWAGYRRWKDERGDNPYQRTSASGFRDGRRVNAVCWHGFRDYFRTVFTREPDAVFCTAVATWKGSKDFERRYKDSGYHNVGSQMYPRMMAEVCRCGEEGYVG